MTTLHDEIAKELHHLRCGGNCTMGEAIASDYEDADAILSIICERVERLERYYEACECSVDENGVADFLHYDDVVKLLEREKQ